MRTPILLTLLFCCLVLFSNAQRSVRDSVNYYQGRLGRIYRQVYDSLAHSDSVRYYRERASRAKDPSRKYTAFMVFTGMMSADFRAFNTAILRDGFGPMSNAPIWQIGIGISHKAYNGIMIDFNYLIINFNRTDKSNGEKITAQVVDFFQFQLGYAVINTRRFNVYPYAGLSWRSSTLSYDAPATVNNNYNSIASIVQNSRSADGAAGHLGYQAGLGIDWAMTDKKKNHAGTILFGKFGTSGIFGDETYNISGVSYPSQIKYGAWTAELGFKFFGR